MVRAADAKSEGLGFKSSPCHFLKNLSFCKNQIDSCIYNNFTHINNTQFMFHGLEKDYSSLQEMDSNLINRPHIDA